MQILFLGLSADKKPSLDEYVRQYMPARVFHLEK